MFKFLQFIVFICCIILSNSLVAQIIPKTGPTFTYKDLYSHGSCHLDTLDIRTLRGINDNRIKEQIAALAKEKSDAKEKPHPHLFVYKTKKDYRMNVPVTLSDDKTKIISYPDPKDFKVIFNKMIRGKKYIPVELHESYLLDKRGIGKTVAFLDMTFMQYAKLKNFPNESELMKKIIDKDPLIYYGDAGPDNTFKNPVKDINTHIDEKKLGDICKTLK